MTNEEANRIKNNIQNPSMRVKENEDIRNKEKTSLDLRESLKKLSRGRRLEAIEEERESECTREDKHYELERYTFQRTDPRKLSQRQMSEEARRTFRKEVKAKVDSLRISKSKRGVSKDYIQEVDAKINTMLMKDGKLQ